MTLDEWKNGTWPQTHCPLSGMDGSGAVVEGSASWSFDRGGSLLLEEENVLVQRARGADTHDAPSRAVHEWRLFGPTYHARGLIFVRSTPGDGGAAKVIHLAA